MDDKKDEDKEKNVVPMTTCTSNNDGSDDVKDTSSSTRNCLNTIFPC